MAGSGLGPGKKVTKDCDPKSRVNKERDWPRLRLDIPAGYGSRGSQNSGVRIAAVYAFLEPADLLQQGRGSLGIAVSKVLDEDQSVTGQGFALISLRDMGVEEVRSQESE